VAAVELYDHRGEPTFPTNFDQGENVNVAENASFAGVLLNLSALIKASFGNLSSF